MVYCNQGHSDTDEKLAESKISSLERDQVRMYTSIPGCNNSCLDAYLHFPLFHFVIVVLAYFYCLVLSPLMVWHPV